MSSGYIALSLGGLSAGDGGRNGERSEGGMRRCPARLPGPLPESQGQRCSAESPGAAEGPSNAPRSLRSSEAVAEAADTVLCRRRWHIHAGSWGGRGSGMCWEPPCPVHRWLPRVAFSPPGTQCLLSDGHSGGLGTVTRHCLVHLGSALFFFYYFLHCELSSVDCHPLLTSFFHLLKVSEVL